MTQHVAMQQPTARIVGDQSDLPGLPPIDQYCVPPWPQSAVGKDQPEMVTMQVHGVRKGRFINELDSV